MNKITRGTGVPSTEEITLTAPDISCGHCIETLQQAITALPAVEFVGGNPDTKTIVLRYDPSVTPLSTIAEAMEEEGYPVSR